LPNLLEIFSYPQIVWITLWTVGRTWNGPSTIPAFMSV
jgi:hypothetical protein